MERNSFLISIFPWDRKTANLGFFNNRIHVLLELGVSCMMYDYGVLQVLNE